MDFLCTPTLNDYLYGIMKLFTASQIRQWYAFTIEKEPITSLELMERAASTCFDWLKEHSLLAQPIKIFCGKGNNGGDGLVIARLMLEKGLHPLIYILEFGHLGSENFQANLQKLHLLTKEIHFLQSQDFFPIISDHDIVVDAVFGSGLNRPLVPLTEGLIKHINLSNATVVSIDMPSGMMIDESTKNKTVIRADHTLTFETLKRCFFLAENSLFFGKLSILPIGLDKRFVEITDTNLQTLTPALIRNTLQPREPFSHKGNHGHALLMAGNKGKIGAAVMAAKACLRSGAGLLTVNIPDTFANVIHSSIPEAMVFSREEQMRFLNIYRCIGIGPGLGTDPATEKIMENVLTHYSNPMVIDADALNILSNHKRWMQKLPAGSILAPHPKEFDRIFGSCENDYERADKALSISLEYPIVLILKGHYTLITSEGKGWYNMTGNAGMAKGGTGDVLTGMLTAFLSQQYEPLQAAMIAVYLHGLAADLALCEQSMESLVATDIIEFIGKAFEGVKS
jgi:NAD(P)H-hydrate epimerase